MYDNKEQVYTKCEDLKYVESCFTDIKSGEDVEDCLMRIQRALGRVFPDLKFKVNIVPTNTNTSPTEYQPVCIYPEPSTCYAIIDAVFDKRGIDKAVEIAQTNDACWIIEIDGDMLNSLSRSFSPADIVACILHNIWMNIYQNTIVTSFISVYNKTIYQLEPGEITFINIKTVRSLFILAIIAICQNGYYPYINIDDLTSTDNMVVKLGYKEAYNNFVNRLISHYGNFTVDKTEGGIISEVSFVMNSLVEMIKGCQFSVKPIKKALEIEKDTATSPYVKAVIDTIYDDFFKSNPDIYRAALSEQYMDIPTDKYAELEREEELIKIFQKAVTESLASLFDKSGNIKKISQHDIDMIEVDVQRIETYDDKIYVLDKIYNTLQTIELAIDYARNNKNDSKLRQSEATLNGYRDRLYALRNQTMATRIIEKEYGVFIRYPKGYEG